MIKWHDFLVPDAIVADLQAAERDAVIDELVGSLVDAGAAPAELRQELVDHIIEREQRGSTGVGKGVAVPHARHPKVPKMMATIGISAKGVDFNALDKAPVHSIVLLLSPEEQRDEHLQAMENIFSNLQKDNFRRFLRQSSSRDEVVELIQEADAQQLTG